MKARLLSPKEEIIRSYLNKDIIVDTGPLILLLAGNYNLDLIGKSQLTREFNKYDFELLQYFISKFRKVIVTPQILAEVSNIINTKRINGKFSDFIEKTINILLQSKEIYINKNEILAREEIKKVGVTDTGIILCCEKNDQMILTKDFEFVGICRSKGLPVIHFDELREMAWSS